MRSVLLAIALATAAAVPALAAPLPVAITLDPDLADLVAVVALSEPYGPCQLTAQGNPLEKLINEDGAAIVRQRVCVGRDAQIFRPTSHYTRTSPKVRFWCKPPQPSQSSGTSKTDAHAQRFTQLSG